MGFNPTDGSRWIVQIVSTSHRCIKPVVYLPTRSGIRTRLPQLINPRLYQHLRIILRHEVLSVVHQQ